MLLIDNINYFNELALRAHGSYLLKAGILTTGAAVSLLYACTKRNMLVGIAALALVCLTYLYTTQNTKGIRNEFGLNRVILLNHLGKFSWFSRIIPEKLVVGALPLANFGHAGQLDLMGISDYLSVVEDDEFNPKFLSVPVKHQPNEHWLQIPCADHNPLTPQDLDRAVEWIHEKINHGGQVYVHCKAGKGRSVIAVIAYLMKYGPEDCPEMMAGTNPDLIYTHIKENLRHEINANHAQRELLRDYFQKLKAEDSKPNASADARLSSKAP